MIPNNVLKYSLAIFGFFFIVGLGTNIFSTTIIEAFHLSIGFRLSIIFLEIIVTAGILTGISVNAFPVIRDLLITLRRLTRFDNLSHPLLIKLSQEAPSTYHHSIMVANLAYRGAKAIGANPILTRVGAYYHDIGKLVNPDHFTENQSVGKINDIHQTLNPQKSAQLIIDHVKQGIRLGQQYTLPPEIINFIPQHHGTSVAQYFYHKARQADRQIRKERFRYPGPKPLSKETALVMLADSIESRIRAIEKLTRAQIQQSIDETMVEKLDDDQLELSGLTARDIARVRRAFSQTLMIMNHRRIQYPKNE